MTFNSLQYLIFLPIVFLTYYLLSFICRKISKKNKVFNFCNLFLLIVSLYFYGSWMPKYLVLILGTIFITYLTSILIDKYPKNKKRFLIFGIIINLVVLFVFKYYNFFLDNLNQLFDTLNINWHFNNRFNFMLPVGISFYTFQSIGYCIDVYRGDTSCEKNFITYASFVTFFPQLVAGPIERSGNLIKQFYYPHQFDYANGVEGLRYILSGMFRKVVIADMCAIIVNAVYNNVHEYNGLILIVATFLFAIQIYCDFSGYSMIAIGSGKLLGFDLMENFKSPYLSTSIKEFWARWHISLSSWFKDYIYIPLGGSRKGFVRKLINLVIIFLISGLWHGAAWTFVIWGLIHAFYRVIEDIYGMYYKKMNATRKIELEELKKDKNVLRYIEINSSKINRYNFLSKMINGIVVFVLINISWIFFRANSIYDAFYIIRNLFIGNFNIMNVYEQINLIIQNSLLDKYIFSKFFIIVTFLSIVYLFVEDYIMKKNSCNISDFYNKLSRYRYLIYSIQVIVIIVMWLILVATYGQTGQFIYFQF